jgi:hypothetical protein
MRDRADLRDDHGVDGFHPKGTISHPAKGQSLSYQFYYAVAMLSFPNQTIVYKNNLHQLFFPIDDLCIAGMLALKIEGFVGRRYARSGSVGRIELIRTAAAGARLFRPNVRATIARPR